MVTRGVLVDCLISLESGKREKGGALQSGIPSLGAEHLTKNGGICCKNMCYISEGYFNTLKKGIVQKNDILLVKDGATTGKVSFVDETFSFENAAINEHLFLLRPNNTLIPKYLFYYLYSPSGQEKIMHDFRGSTVGGITKNFAKMEIPINSKEKQQHIVKVLDTITSIIEKRKQQITLLDDAEESLFVEMFGDNVTIMKWNQQALGNIADIIVGVVIKPAQYYSNAKDGVKAFRSLNVAESKIKDENWVYFSVEGQNANKKSILKEGDVLVVRSGNPGIACVATKEYEGCNAIDIIIARPNYEYLESEYLCRFTNSNCCKEMIKSKTNGVAQQHFNVGAYKSLMIPVPPLSLQNDFASRISLIEEHRTEMQTDLKQMEELKSALMQQYFG